MTLVASRLASDRVRTRTDALAQAHIDDETLARLEILAQAPAAAIEARMRELDAEWDIGRLLQLGAGAVALVGVALGALVDRRFLLLSAAALASLMQHAALEWSPPMGAFRRVGARTRREIEAERVALKALLGELEGTARDRGSPIEQAHRAFHRAAA